MLLITDVVSSVLNISVKGTHITGSLPTVHGTARMTLDLSADAVTGTIADGGQQWSIDGRRTG